MSDMPHAEAVFGSWSRGDSDDYSDRDILIVGDDRRCISDRRAELTASGWSVAIYTWSKLQTLAQSGALFVQHLKDEATITKDDSGRLARLLHDFRPKASYESDLLTNSQLADIAGVRPATDLGALWAADVLYVALRNFGVLYLAERRKYLFSYGAILHALADDHVFSADAIRPLLQLRIAKSLYRSAPEQLHFASNDVLNEAIGWLPKKSFRTDFVGVTPELVLQSIERLASNVPSYHRLRNLERGYVARRALCCDTSPQLRALRRWIENPREYAHLAAAFEGELLSHVKADGVHKDKCQWLVCTSSSASSNTNSSRATRELKQWNVHRCDFARVDAETSRCSRHLHFYQMGTMHQSVTAAE